MQSINQSMNQSTLVALGQLCSRLVCSSKENTTQWLLVVFEFPHTAPSFFNVKAQTESPERSYNFADTGVLILHV